MGHVRRVAVHAWRSFAYDVRVGRSSRWIVWRSRAPSIFLFSGGAVVGFLVVNRRGTRCANQVPCVERSSLRFDTAFRPDREIEFTHKLQRAASLLAPIQHHVYCWMQAEKDPDAAHKWLSLTSLPVCEMSHGQTPSRSELIESPRRNPDRIQQPKSRVRLPEDLDERKREESERTGNTSAARLAKMLTKMQKGDSSSQFDDRAIAAAGSGNYVRADGRAHEEELLEANVPAVLANHWVARGFLSQHFQHSPSLARVSVDSIKKAQGAVEWFAEQLLDEATWNRMVTQDKKLEGLLEGGIDNRTRSCRSQEGNDSRCLVDSNYPHYSYSFLKQTHDELERVGVVKVEALIPLQVIREIRRKLDIAPLRHSPYEKIQNDWREDVKAHGLTGAEKGTSSWLMSRGEDDETYLKDGPGGKSLQLYHVVAEFDCRRFDPQYILQFSYEKMRARVWQEKQTRRDRDCDYIDTSVDTDRIWERGPRRAVAEKCGSQEMMLPGGSVGSSIEANKSELPPEQRERMKNYVQNQSKSNTGIRGRRWETFDEIAALWMEDYDPKDENPVIPSSGTCIGRSYYFMKNTHFERVVQPMLTFLTPLVNTYFETTGDGRTPYISGITLGVSNSRCLDEAWHRDSKAPGVTFVVPLTNTPENLGALDVLGHSHNKARMWCTSIKSGPLRTSLRPSDVLVYDQRTLKRARANPAYTRATICLFVSYNTERPPGFGPPSMYWNSFVGNFVEKLHCWQTMQSPALCFLNGVANHAWGRCVLPVPWSGRDLGLELGFLQGATNDAYELGTSVAGGAVVGT